MASDANVFQEGSRRSQRSRSTPQGNKVIMFAVSACEQALHLMRQSKPT